MSMKERTMEISNYLEELASSAATPGGGSASALSALIGISLLQMAISLTKGKKKYIEYTQVYEVVEEALAKSKKICEWGMKEDAIAFGKVMEVYRNKSKTQELKDYEQQLKDAIIYAAEVPLKVAQSIKSAILVIDAIKDKLNPWVVSDLIGGIETLNGAIRSVLLNVAINVKSLSEGKDKTRLHGEMINCLKETIYAYRELKQYLYEADTFKNLYEVDKFK